MHTFLQDARYAVRSWRHAIGPVGAAIAALALGIGATTTIFTMVYGVLLKPLPYPEPESLVMLWHDRRADNGSERDFLSPGLVVEWQRRATAFESIGAIRNWQPNITGDGEPERLVGAAVSHGYFAALRMPPLLGRSFTLSDDAPGAPPVVLISHGLWARRFGADTGILGRSLVLDGQPVSVIGVMPPGFQPPVVDAQIWTPLRIDPANAPRGLVMLRAVARLAHGTSLDAARASMAAVDAQLAAEEREWMRARAAVVPLHEDMVGPVREMLVVLLGAAALVLLIACANVTSLLLARAVDRAREVSVRVALGANRSRIIRQLFTETVLLSSVAGGLGTLLGWYGVELLVGIAPSSAPRVRDVQFDWAVLGVAVGVTFAAALVAGLVPALSASRAQLSLALRDGGREVTRGGWMRSALVVAEIAIALVLLTGAGLLVRTLIELQRVDLGFSAERILTGSVQPPRAMYRRQDAVRDLYERILAGARQLPEVEAAAITSVLPLSGMDIVLNFGIPGRPPGATPGDSPAASMRVVSADYFRVMGIRLAEGRSFTTDDRDDAPRVAIVNEVLARRYWPGESAVGKRIFLEGRETTIVGTLVSVRHRGAAESPQPELYLASTQSNPRMGAWIVVKTQGDPMRAVGSLREVVKRADPLLPLSAVAPMTQLVARTVAQPRFVAVLLSGFGLIAAVLALVGVYSVLAFSVTRRIREFGVRMALGARPMDVIGLTMRSSMALIGIGITIGSAAALALTRLLNALLFGVTPADPVTFVTMGLSIATAAAVAAYIPAHRGSRIDPVVALREE